MGNKLRQYFQNTIPSLFPPPPREESAYRKEAKRALQELKAAESYYNSVSHPELVDYAAFEIEAARRKYEYLLNQIRSEESRSMT